MKADFFCEKCENNPLILDIEYSNEFEARCVCGECGYVTKISAKYFNEDYEIIIGEK